LTTPIKKKRRINAEEIIFWNGRVAILAEGGPSPARANVSVTQGFETKRFFNL
jgi:hypothetical protein